MNWQNGASWLSADTGWYKNVSNSTSFSISYISNNSTVASQSSYTYTAQGIGTADPTRIVAVAISYNAGSGANAVSGVTIGGNAATSSGAATTSTVGAATDIYYLAVPTGTTANIVVSFSVNPSRIAISVYSVIGTGASFSTAASAQNGSSVSTLTQSGTIPTGGGAISVITIHTSTPGTVTPTNLTTDTNLTFGSSTTVAGHNTASSGATTMGFSWAGSATDAALSIVTFNP